MVLSVRWGNADFWGNPTLLSEFSFSPEALPVEATIDSGFILGELTFINKVVTPDLLSVDFYLSFDITTGSGVSNYMATYNVNSGASTADDIIYLSTPTLLEPVLINNTEYNFRLLPFEIKIGENDNIGYGQGVAIDNLNGIVAVPEPSTLFITTICLLITGIFARRKWLHL